MIKVCFTYALIEYLLYACLFAIEYSECTACYFESLGFDVFRIVFFILSDLLSDCLCVVTIACLRQIDRSVTSRSIKSFECESSSSTLQASSHFDHIPFHTQFLCISFTLKHCMSRIDNMWDGKQMRQYLLHVYYQTFGSYFYVCLLCHAMLVDVDWVLRVSMTDVRLLINGLLKVAT